MDKRGSSMEVQGETKSGGGITSAFYEDIVGNQGNWKAGIATIAVKPDGEGDETTAQ
jgi:hypothetical protein